MSVRGAPAGDAGAGPGELRSHHGAHHPADVHRVVPLRVVFGRVL